MYVNLLYYYVKLQTHLYIYIYKPIWRGQLELNVKRVILGSDSCLLRCF